MLYGKVVKELIKSEDRLAKQFVSRHSSGGTPRGAKARQRQQGQQGQQRAAETGQLRHGGSGRGSRDRGGSGRAAGAWARQQGYGSRGRGTAGGSSGRGADLGPVEPEGVDSAGEHGRERQRLGRPAEPAPAPPAQDGVADSRRQDCHFTDALSSSLLKRLRKGEGVQQNDSLADG